MTKLEFFIESVEKELYRYRAWSVSVFGIMLNDTSYDVKDLSPESYLTSAEEEYYICRMRVDDEQLAILRDDDSWDPILDYVYDTPLYHRNELVTIPKGFMNGWITEDTKTTYGIWLVNMMIVYFPYRGEVPYQNGEINEKFNTIAYKRLMAGDVESHLRFENMVGQLSVLAKVGCPAGSRGLLTPRKEWYALRDKLFAENEGKLDDPSTVASIQNQLATMAEKDIKDDPSFDYITNPGKQIHTSMLRTLVSYGSEPDYYDESKVTLKKHSLMEGWRRDDLPMIANTSRGGSLARGKETAMGGYEVKLTARLFQNYQITSDDCGVKYGLQVPINAITVDMFEGRYVAGRKTPLTKEDLVASIGKTLEIRSPFSCKMEKPTFCKKCFGDRVGSSNVGLLGQAIMASDVYMSLFMAMMHSTSLKVEQYEPELCIY